MIAKKSIVVKLWAAVTGLILLVSGISAITQTRLMEAIYYDQQAKLMVYEGQEVAGLIKLNDENIKDEDRHAAEQITLMANFLKTNVTVVDRQGLVQFTRSVSLRKNPEVGTSFREGGLESVLEGNTLVNRGWSNFWETDVLSAAVPIRVNGETTGAVLIHSPLGPIAERMRAFQQVALYTAAGGILLATVLGFILSRNLSRPLLRMNKVAQAIARGDFTSKVPVQSSDEIGLLAGSLNKLSEDLQANLAALNRLDQTRRDFVANVSHELRTPLTIILGFTDAILAGIPENDNERDQYLLNIQDEAQRLQRLVNDLLDLRKMEAGQAEMPMAPVYLALLIDRVIEKLTRQLKEKDIKMVTGLSRNLPRVPASEDHLERVFINLLGNAIRFSPNGGSIAVEARPRGNTMEVSISDSGPGIPPEELPLIWERFYKVDKSRARTVGGGTGLGLAITRQIIEAHGGQINVDSEVGRGSTFTFTLPLQTNSKRDAFIYPLLH